MSDIPGCRPEDEAAERAAERLQKIAPRRCPACGGDVAHAAWGWADDPADADPQDEVVVVIEAHAADAYCARRVCADCRTEPCGTLLASLGCRCPECEPREREED